MPTRSLAAVTLWLALLGAPLPSAAAPITYALGGPVVFDFPAGAGGLEGGSFSGRLTLDDAVLGVPVAMVGALYAGAARLELSLAGSAAAKAVVVDADLVIGPGGFLVETPDGLAGTYGDDELVFASLLVGFATTRLPVGPPLPRLDQVEYQLRRLELEYGPPGSQRPGSRFVLARVDTLRCRSGCDPIPEADAALLWSLGGLLVAAAARRQPR